MLVQIQSSRRTLSAASPAVGPAGLSSIAPGASAYFPSAAPAPSPAAAPVSSSFAAGLSNGASSVNGVSSYSSAGHVVS